jgi:non-specific serine/threonine protein kinase
MTFDPAANVDVLPAGTRLDGYEITGLIGQGGFGVVYVARDATNKRTVAIKEFLPAAIAGRSADGRVVPRSVDLGNAYATGVKGFLREANLLSEFAHPALVYVHRAWEQNGTAYMSMQYYPGKTLREVRLSAPEGMSEAHIKLLMSPVFEAVSELHAHRVIHRDISPDNILVTPRGETVLLDLGAARQVLGGMTQALTTILKPGFAPIEQYVEDGSMEQGRWTDVYGLGAVIYFLASGKPPTPATSRIVRDSQPSIPEVAVGASYSPALVSAVNKALSVRAIDRFKSISEFRNALGWAIMPRPVAQPAEKTEVAAALTADEIRRMTAPEAEAGALASGSNAAPWPAELERRAPPPPPRAPASTAKAPVSGAAANERVSSSQAVPAAATTRNAPLGKLRGKAGNYEAPGRSRLVIPAVIVTLIVLVVVVVLLRR